MLPRSSKEIECGSSGGGSKNLFRTEQNDDDDKAAPTTTNTATTAPPQVAAAESLRRLRLDKALWMHSPKIIQKRDYGLASLAFSFHFVQ